MKRRSLLVYVSLVVALGIAGVAYASWSAQLSVQGVVETGAFGVEWLDWSAEEAGEPLYEGRPVARVTLDGSSGSTIKYQVKNAFPNWSGKLRVKVKNTGTIPATIDEVAFEGSDGISVSGYAGLEGLTLGAGVSSGELVFTVSVGEVAQETNYEFTLEINATQWNVTD